MGRPGDALQRQAAGLLTMMPPTVKNLEFVAAHPDTASAIRAARLLGRPQAICSRLRRDAQGRIRGVSLPGDDDFDDLSDEGG